MLVRKTVLAHALTVAFAATVAASSAYAQSNIGNINGRAASGAVVTAQNPAIGVTRTVTAAADGTYNLSQLPPGNYLVRVKLPDGTTRDQQVTVQAGEGSTANFEADTPQTVVVTGRATRIDVKSAESSLVLNKAAIDRIPVARNVTAVALLAPGATAGDTRIGQTALRGGNVPSLGGASPAENVYYINGFNVTNALNGVAFNQVPFDAIGQQQVKTGGYGPEYGRSLGGVLSVTTKRGTNEWHGGVNMIYSPESMSGSSVYAEKSTVTGKYDLQERAGGTDDLQANVWAGGPLIKDRLFFFGLVQGADITRETYSLNRQETVKSNSPRFLTKFDWNLNDSNLVEFTAFSDKSTDKVQNYISPVPYGKQRGASQGNDEYVTGGENFIAKYTSWVTDDLTVSGMYGVGKYNRQSNIASAACPYITDRRTAPTVRLGCATATTIVDPDANDERKAFRLDAEWNLGAHGLRFGMDNEEYKVVDGTFYPGGENYQIRRLASGSTLSNGYRNTSGSPMDYVEIRHFENGGAFTTKNSAFYLEDNWQVTKNLVASIGVRSESFENLNAEDKTFIKVDNTIAPRLGLTWDVRGNAQTKVFANAGRYYIPVMSNTNVRLSGAELDYREFYAYTGSNSADKFQIPGRGAQLGGRAVSSNGEAGDPRSVVDPEIKPMYQDEFILGAQQALNNRWSVSAKLTHRKLKSVMDDMCNDEGAYNWAIANGYDEDKANILGGSIGHCFLYNPGGDLTANVDFEDGNGLTRVVIPAAALGFPKPKRTFNSLELGFERAWDGKWTVQGSYVLAYNKGNTEGYVKSDIGQDDAGISQDWDYPGLMEGAYGYLPNDRRHSLKVFGSYQVLPELRLGANLILQSGRPKNCLGYYAGDLDGVSILYGAASFYCGGKLNPRGSFGRTDWTRNLGLQATYEPKWLKGTTFQVDVLNVFNERTVTSIEEGGESALNTPSPTYGQPVGITAARSVRFLAQYEF
ncbi:TonB-dependent receptor [Massilia soli]|uniref:TonB-dependent receptor n=1 Tax=Massilia soli TaxID=2792854 RepID=A0ABS7SRX0_9BURK|nr:TonB-dependent receptor [Massilia soli]MBZ2208682.1 TonB-dependent receptor [Massilia soli]